MGTQDAHSGPPPLTAGPSRPPESAGQLHGSVSRQEEAPQVPVPTAASYDSSGLPPRQAGGPPQDPATGRLGARSGSDRAQTERREQRPARTTSTSRGFSSTQLAPKSLCL